MAKLSKRISEVKALVSKTQLYNLEEAVDLIKKTATAKFKESVDISIQLGIDAKKIRSDGPRGVGFAGGNREERSSCCFCSR